MGVNFGPVIGGPRARCQCFYYEKFPVTRKKSIFREMSKFYFREVQLPKFFPSRALGVPV